MTFFETLTAAVKDITEHGFDSQARLDGWLEQIRLAAIRSFVPEHVLEKTLRNTLTSIYTRMIEKGGIYKYHPGVSVFTVQKVQPALRADLDRRIMASANLIKLNREVAIQRTLQRFSGWTSSVPAGGSEAQDKPAVKLQIRKALAQLPFEERRVAIDQGHKFMSSLNQTIADGGGALAAIWRSHWQQINYDYRKDHKDRDNKTYAIRGNWALEKGLMKAGLAGYLDQITQPAEEINCFPGDSNVPFAEGVEIAYRRWYSGELAEMITASGKTLRATPNHPILTPSGWRPLHALNVGDDVIEVAEQLIKPVKDDGDYGRVAMIEEIFGTLRATGIVEPTRSTREDFHGDGTNGQIDIVYAARPLVVNDLQLRAQLPLTDADHFTSRSGAFQQSFMRVLGATTGYVGDSGNLTTSFRANPVHTNDISFTTISQSDTGTLERDVNAAWVTTDQLTDFHSAFPFEVKSSRIVKLTRQPWAGHVYNLQTKDGYYSVGGIIVHNCRCYATYVYALRKLPDDMITIKGHNELDRIKKELAA